MYSTRSIRDIEVKNGEIVDKSYNIKRGETDKYLEIKGDQSPINLTDIKFLYNKQEIKLNVYEKGLRYYSELHKTLSAIGAEVKGEEISFNKEVINLDLNKKTYTKNNKEYSLRGEVIAQNGEILISINDISNMLNLRDRWDIEGKKIYLFREEKNLTPKGSNSTGRAAFIRLEDVSSGGYCGSSIAKEKMKIIGDQLYKNNMKFHVAWVPRYVNPSKGVDNELSKSPTMDNVQFVNMLDHLINRGGVVGLHGYTHQSGGEPSLAGWELTRKINSSEEETRNIIESSIKEAKTLNIPIGFFESPHYGATAKQQRIIEEYFNILYEPYSPSYNLNPMIGFRGEGKLYLPAPMGYVTDKNGESLVKKINYLHKHILASLFIHGSAQMPFIELGDLNESGYGDYKILDDSPLTNIIKGLKDTGHVTITTNDL